MCVSGQRVLHSTLFRRAVYVCMTLSLCVFVCLVNSKDLTDQFSGSIEEIKTQITEDRAVQLEETEKYAQPVLPCGCCHRPETDAAIAVRQVASTIDSDVGAV